LAEVESLADDWRPAEAQLRLVEAEGRCRAVPLPAEPPLADDAADA